MEENARSQLRSQIKSLLGEIKELERQIHEHYEQLERLFSSSNFDKRDESVSEDLLGRIKTLIVKKNTLENQLFEDQSHLLRKYKERKPEITPQIVLNRNECAYDAMAPPKPDSPPGPNQTASEDTNEPLKRSISLKKYASWTEKSSLEDPGLKGIVRGFPRKKAAAAPSPYAPASWSVGFQELVDIGRPVICTNRGGALVKHAKFRGDDVLLKIFSPRASGFNGTEQEAYNFFSSEITSTLQKTCVFLAEEKGVCVEGDNIIFVREYCARGSLADILQLDKSKPKPAFKLSFWRKMNIAQSVASAMDFILKNGFSNPNLNLTNILFTEDWDVKLADQSFRKFKQLSKESRESLDDIAEPHLVFQFGLLLWKLVTETDSSPLQSGELVEVPKHCPNKLIDLILHCCNLDPENRPTFSSLVHFDTFDGIFCEADTTSVGACEMMWDRLARGRDAVSWDEFAPVFCSTFEIPYHGLETDSTIEFLCLRSMFDLQASKNIKDRKRTQTIVTREAFQRLIKCIGPFIEGGEIIDQVKALLEAPWFMGVLSAQEADELIDPLPASSKPFLVRFSSSTGDYSITFKTKEKILHSRVPQTAKYNLHQYIELLKQKKKFKTSPPSPFVDLLGLSAFPGYRPWTFVR